MYSLRDGVACQIYFTVMAVTTSTLHSPFHNTKHIQLADRILIPSTYTPLTDIRQSPIRAKPPSIHVSNRGCEPHVRIFHKNHPLNAKDAFPPNHTRRLLQIYFLLNEHPSVSLAFPPVGWHSTCEQPAQTTTVWAWEKTVVMVKQPGHLTSMKKERGAGTRVCFGTRLDGVGSGGRTRPCCVP